MRSKEQATRCYTGRKGITERVSINFTNAYALHFLGLVVLAFLIDTCIGYNYFDRMSVMSRPHFEMAGGNCKLVNSLGEETAVDIGEHTLGRGPLLKVIALVVRLGEN